MSKTLIGSSVGLLALALVATSAQAGQRHRHVVAHKKAKAVAYNAAENGLIGIHLFDSSEHVIGVYGSPDDIQPLNLNTGTTGGGFGGGAGGFGGGPGGAGPAGGFRGGPTGRPGGGGGPGSPMTPASNETPDIGDLPGSEFDFGDGFLQRPLGGPMRGGPGAGGGFPGGVPGGRPGGFPGGGAEPGGPGGGFPGGPGGFPGGRNPGAGSGGGFPGGGGATESVTYTRWIYNRSNNKFAFVINRLGQVIQIEAIGLSNPKVKTKRGIGFGSHFGTIVKAYHNPDGYDIGGDNILVKYLVHDKVAFRLTRIGDKQPHQVTGIVVSAGKG